MMLSPFLITVLFSGMALLSATAFVFALRGVLEDWADFRAVPSGDADMLAVAKLRVARDTIACLTCLFLIALGVTVALRIEGVVVVVLLLVTLFDYPVMATVFGVYNHRLLQRLRKVKHSE